MNKMEQSIIFICLRSSCCSLEARSDLTRADILICAASLRWDRQTDSRKWRVTSHFLMRSVSVRRGLSPPVLPWQPTAGMKFYKTLLHSLYLGDFCFSFSWERLLYLYYFLNYSKINRTLTLKVSQLNK